MKIVIAPDKFKGSLSALEVCRAIGRGLKKSRSPVKIIFHPLADGGDGSLAVLTRHLKLTPQNTITTDPLGRKIQVQYFTSSGAAFIEMAGASGLVLLEKKDRNPLVTTTFGTGKMIADAISRGFRDIYLFLGGSATNDAGMGIAKALGYRFLDNKKEELQPVGESLPKVRFIRNTPLFDFKKINMTLLYDVTNPLFGPTGAAHVYARQKGATDEQVDDLDKGLKHFSNIIQKQTGIDVRHLPGSGAAGGTGAGLTALFGAKLESGFAIISKLTGLEQQIRSADRIISGEGKLDAQSLQGKVVGGVAGLCQKYEKPLTLFVGKNELSTPDMARLGIQQVYAIIGKAKNIEDAMSNAAAFLEDLATRFRLS